MGTIDGTNTRNPRPMGRGGHALLVGLMALHVASCTEPGDDATRVAPDLRQAAGAERPEPNGIQAFEVQFTAPAQTWHSAPVTVSGTINDPDCNTAPGVETVGVNDYTLSGGNGSWTFTKASVGAGR